MDRLQGAVALSLKSAELRLLAAEGRAAGLAEAVQFCRAELATLVSSTEEIEGILDGIVHKSSTKGQYVRSLERALEEAGVVSGKAAAEIVGLTDVLQRLQQEVKSRIGLL